MQGAKIGTGTAYSRELNSGIPGILILEKSQNSRIHGILRIPNPRIPGIRNEYLIRLLKFLLTVPKKSEF